MTGFVLTTSNQIDAWRLLALYHMLHLELKGMRHSSGKRASVAIRKVLREDRRGAPRDRQRLLKEYRLFLVDKGFLADIPEAP